MKIISYRTTMPFDNRSTGDYASLSPATQKSVMPFNNVPTIQDILSGEVSIQDVYPHARGNWAPGEDVSKSYKEKGDEYKRKEKDLEIINKMTNVPPKHVEKWKVKIPGGSISFESFDLAQRYLRKNRVPLRYLSRIAKSLSQNEKIERNKDRIEIISDSLNKCFMVESLNFKDNVKEVGSAFCIEKNHFITCAHVIKKYNKNVGLNDSGFFDGIVVNLLHYGTWIPAKVLSVDLKFDIALIEAEIDIDPFQLSMEYTVGEDIIAIGSPHGYENEVSSGTVGSLHRKPMSYDGAPEYMFVDLSVFPGSSGGPIIKESDGKVIGMITLIISDDETGYGLNAGLSSLYIEQFYKSFVNK